MNKHIFLANLTVSIAAKNTFYNIFVKSEGDFEANLIEAGHIPSALKSKNLKKHVLDVLK